MTWSTSFRGSSPFQLNVRTRDISVDNLKLIKGVAEGPSRKDLADLTPSLAASSGRLDEKARGAQTSTPTRLANPQAGQALPRKSLKNRIKALSSRERLVNVQE